MKEIRETAPEVHAPASDAHFPSHHQQPAFLPGHKDDNFRKNITMDCSQKLPVHVGVPD